MSRINATMAALLILGVEGRFKFRTPIIGERPVPPVDPKYDVERKLRATWKRARKRMRSEYYQKAGIVG